MNNTNFETNRSNRHSENKSIEVTSPYNFVPLSDVIYFPSWSKQISQDAPFKKSYSGCIEFKVKAKSPIFVRNGHTQEQMEEAKEICKSISQQINNEISKKLNLPSHISKKEKEETLLTYLDANKTEWQEMFMKLLERKAADGADLSYLKFSNINEKFFIPSTSIKGCIRNALEILSYGKIGNRISDDRYGFREMTDQYLTTMDIDNIHCGYFSLQNDIMTITDHDIPFRISHAELDKGIPGLNFEYTFQQNYRREQMMSPFYKLNQLSRHTLPTRFNEISNLYGKKMVEVNTSGNIEGRIIVTGQPGKRELKYDYKLRKEKWVGKFYEFVFPVQSITQYTCDTDSNLYKDFIFINKDSGDWDTWKTKIDQGDQIPVFFTLIDGKIRDMGLSYMYKRPYKYKISDCLYPEHSSNEKDLAECIFGVSGDLSTRGRVQFSHAFANQAIFSWAYIEQLILNSPKASYYPFYIEQYPEDNGNLTKYNTYLDDDSLINGWKKYPVRNGTTSKKMNNPKLDTFLTPLDTGSEFTCKMRFFNLKGVELGALLSVLTFHDSKENYYHSIGQGKPYGLGKIEIEIENLLINGNLSEKSKISDAILIFLRTFENDFYRTTELFWNKSENVKEFYTMSYDVLAASDSLFQYLELGDFPKIKKENEYLKRFSKICNKEKYPQTFMQFK